MTNDEPTVPYSSEPISTERVPTKYITATLSTGAVVRVGVQEGHPHGGRLAVIHEFRHTQPDGKRTKLRFCCSQEAVTALVVMYLQHGLVSVSNVRMQKGKSPIDTAGEM